jgi:hypothetical protein
VWGWCAQLKPRTKTRPPRKHPPLAGPAAARRRGGAGAGGPRARGGRVGARPAGAPHARPRKGGRGHGYAAARAPRRGPGFRSPPQAAGRPLSSCSRTHARPPRPQACWPRWWRSRRRQSPARTCPPRRGAASRASCQGWGVAGRVWEGGLLWWTDGTARCDGRLQRPKARGRAAGRRMSPAPRGAAAVAPARARRARAPRAAGGRDAPRAGAGAGARGGGQEGPLPPCCYACVV